MESILNKLMTLDGDIEVYPGHGESTTIGVERSSNPFLEPFNEPLEEFDGNE
jgi:glyoxylase-like metal-dependent hydrolase (beta-lactamase superfamily II)